jgi:DHA1 family tetracycline resistance protein-like MFS transporter
MSRDASSPGIGRVLPLYLVVFIGFLGYSLMITVFTPMLLDQGSGFLPADASTSERTLVLGVLLALYPLAQFLGAPVIGSLSDRFGRKRVLLASLAASTAAYCLIAGALEAESLALLMVASLVAGFSEANIAIAQSAVADVAPAAGRARLFGYVYLASSLAYVVGPLGGGKLADPGLVSWFGYSTPYWAVAILLAGTFVLTLLAFRETHPPDRSARVRLSEALTSLGTVFTERRLRRIYLGNFLLYLSIFGFFRVYPMYLVDEFGMGVSQESEFIAYVAVPIVIANLGLVAWLSRRMSSRAMTASFAVLLGVFMASIVVPESEAALWFTLGPTALALAVCLPGAAALVSEAVGGAEQGKALGANQSLQVGAEALSGVAGGALAAIVVRLPLPVLAGVALVAAGVVASTRGATGAPRAASSPT